MMVLFTYSYKTKTCRSQLSVDVPIPLMYSIDDYCQRLIGFHKIPCFIVSGRYWHTIAIGNATNVNCKFVIVLFLVILVVILVVYYFISNSNTHRHRTCTRIIDFIVSLLVLLVLVY